QGKQNKPKWRNHIMPTRQEKKVQDTTSRLEERLNRRDFVKYSFAIGQAVFIGGVLIGNFTGCKTASKKAEKTRAGEKTSIKFAHVTDTHVTFTGKNGTALKGESFNIFRDIIDQITGMDDIDFILFGGDNINNTDPGTKGFDEFMNIVSGVKVPYFAQFGNRESSPIPPGIALSKEQYAEKMKGHGLDTGSYSWSVSPVPGLRILGLDTSIIDHDNGEIPQAELEWFKEEIAEYPHDIIVTLSHHLLLPTWGNRDIPKWKKKYLLNNYQEVNTVLESASQIKMCLTGHHHVSKIQTVNGLHYIASPATVQYPHAFRTITINDNEAKLQFHQVRDQGIIKIGKKYLLTSKNAEEYAGGKADDILAYCHGGESDNNVVLKLRRSLAHADGETHIGMRSSYRNLSVSQVQSMPHISIREKKEWGFYGHSTINHSYDLKTINRDKVVIDHATGLMWHQSGSSNSMNWDDAKRWVRDLNGWGYAGYHDWRLPTLEEAASLLEAGKRSGLYIDSVFSNKQEWSWTGDEYDSEDAWSVSFGLGGVYRNGVSDDDNGVRPVRSGK
ncbi:MAG: DUF1566 domain-containing protein, partial [Candidatus Scalindua sp.]